MGCGSSKVKGSLIGGSKEGNYKAIKVLVKSGSKVDVKEKMA